MNYSGQFEYSAVNGWYTAQVNRRKKTGNKCVHTAKLNTFHFFFSSDILQSVDFGGNIKTGYFHSGSVLGHFLHKSNPPGLLINRLKWFW